LGPHSYDPGITPSLVTWTTPIPEDGVEINLHRGRASLRVRNVCVFDAFTVRNSLTLNHPDGIVGATIDSMHLAWSGVTREIPGFSAPVNGFAGDFVETAASIEVTVTTQNKDGHGFRFVSDATTAIHFAQIGRERNGVFFD
jgi:hypothetical protein